MTEYINKTSLLSSNITVFGDSISKGLYLNCDKVERLNVNAVNLVGEHYGVDIVNNSAFGQTLKRVCGKGVIERYVSSLQGKDIAVLCIGGNDADYNWQDVAVNPTEFHDSKTPIAQFSLLVEQTIRQLQKKGVRVVVTSLPPVSSVRYFDNVISRHCDGDAVMRFLQNDVSNISRHQECFSNVLMQQALTNNCGFVDLRTAFLMKNNLLDYLCEDGIHPNEKGQQLIAETVIGHIEKYCAEVAAV